jgi:hypothetical protein
MQFLDIGENLPCINFIYILYGSGEQTAKIV